MLNELGQRILCPKIKKSQIEKKRKRFFCIFEKKPVFQAADYRNHQNF
jgi:hypothetical protein